jgi:uncharacterized peroxidase-related enzyme
MLLVKDGRSEADAAAVVDALATDYRTAAITGADREMLDYALKLTDTPAAIATDDIDRLRGAGFDDRAIHDICAITAYFAFVNRIADGLGVELEASKKQT